MVQRRSGSTLRRARGLALIGLFCSAGPSAKAAEPADDSGAPAWPCLDNEPGTPAFEDGEDEDGQDTDSLSEASEAAPPDVEIIAPSIDLPPSELVPPELAPGPALPLGEIRFDASTGRYTAPLGAGRATLTLDARLQERLRQELAMWRVPYGATVLLEPATGRVLALAEHSERERGRTGLCFESLALAASVFKIVTASALLEQGVDPDAEVCYHGGRRRISPRLLLDNPRRDRRCITLAAAMGHSTNVVFAKLAGRKLNAAGLEEHAQRFLFNIPIPFVRPLAISKADIPSEPFAFATTAAGFGQVKLSPLHGALLAAIVANGGTFVPPDLIESVQGAAKPDLGAPRRVISEDIAHALGAMMKTTVTEGTARRYFRRKPALRGVGVAGKTGSLWERGEDFKDFTWFVGFAPVDRPRVAIATVIVNGRRWRVKAPQIAAFALNTYCDAYGCRAEDTN